MIEYDIFICVALAIPNIPFNVSSGAMATGKEDVQIRCNPELSVMSGDTFQWYFTRTTVDNSIQLRDSSKYSISGPRSQSLTVRNISLNDEGFYYCRTLRNTEILSEAIRGACVYAYGKLSCITMLYGWIYCHYLFAIA